ncbi:MAG: GNAT family N-acetyltransferase [Candidatus Marinimicrobia bacterium]|nr:GNAT family N-acetyltransferase [Candidatus Neomarinimicrobiota bacterium]
MKEITINRLELNSPNNTGPIELYSLLVNYFNPYYPNFKEWYFSKLVNGLKRGDRGLYIAQKGNEIQGVSIIKYCGSENSKICTFFIFPNARKNGIGSFLMGHSLDTLKQICPRKPIIMTVPGERLYEPLGDYNFEKLTTKFGFKLADIAKNKYRTGNSEYIFKFQ